VGPSLFVVWRTWLGFKVVVLLWTVLWKFQRPLLLDFEAMVRNFDRQCNAGRKANLRDWTIFSDLGKLHRSLSKMRTIKEFLKSLRTLWCN